jgi:hypothetical protein
VKARLCLFLAELARPAVIRLVSAIGRIKGHIEAGADIDVAPQRGRSIGRDSKCLGRFVRRYLALFAELAWSKQAHMQPRHFAVQIAVRVGYGPIALKAEPIEETKETGIILA